MRCLGQKQPPRLIQSRRDRELLHEEVTPEKTYNGRTVSKTTSVILVLHLKTNSIAEMIGIPSDTRLEHDFTEMKRERKR